MLRRLVRPHLAEARARGNAVDRPGKRVDTCGAREDPERMGTLPRPDIPPGPQRDLVVALHELHHRAGWPSLRSLAREAGCSHTTVSNIFSSPRLPTWGALELLVEAMDGDTADFHQLWIAASRPPPRCGPPQPGSPAATTSSSPYAAISTPAPASC